MAISPYRSLRATLLCLLFLVSFSVSGEELIIKFSASVNAKQSKTFLADYGLEVVEKIESLNVCTVAVPSGADIDRLIEKLELDSRTQYVEINVNTGQGAFVPSDEFFQDQWHHYTINSQRAWNISRGSSDTTIAVLDSGLQLGNTEVSGTRFLTGFDFVNNDNAPDDDHGHGTYVTGLIAANADNSYSGTGVDHLASILPVKVLSDENRGTTFDLVQGINYAVEQGADVINMSLVGYPNASSLSDALLMARAKDVILISSAGNGGLGNADISFPGASPHTISVGATTIENRRAFFSGTGAALSVVAPGSAVKTTGYPIDDGRLDFFNGTSAAAPIVTGVAALARALDPNLTHDQFLNLLTLSSRDQVGISTEDIVGRDDFFGWGLLDAAALLDKITPSFTTVPARIEAEAFTASFDTTSGDIGDSLCNTGDVDSRVTNDNNGVCSIVAATAGEWLEYRITADQVGTYSLSFRLASSSGGRVSVEVDGTEVGRISVNDNGPEDYADYSVSAQLSKGTHTLRINFIDDGLNFNYLDVRNSMVATITPRKDAYIRGGSFADDSYGNNANLVLKGNKREQYTRKAYLQFRIKELAGVTVQKAVVRLYANRIDESLEVALHRMISNNASEREISWNNTPAERNELAVTPVFRSSKNRYYEWDVTDYLREKIIYSNLNILLKERNTIDKFVRFNSSEASSNPPQLVVTYTN